MNEDPESISAQMVKGEQLTDLLGPKIVLPPLDVKPTNQEILNAILPPREWIDEGRHFVQFVSNKQVSRLEVGSLQTYLLQ